jgi:hypothetical protein
MSFIDLEMYKEKVHYELNNTEYIIQLNNV